MKIKSKGFYITIWIIVIFFCFIIETYASDYQINSQGVFLYGNKSFARTADVVVCRGQNTLDDFVKQFQCDVVCLSTDSDCGDNINSQSMKNNKDILITCGDYSIGSNYIQFGNNTRIRGESKDCVFLNKQAGFTGGNADVIRLDEKFPFYNNVELSDFTINSSLDSSTVGVGININTVNNLKIHDIDIIGVKGFGLFVGCPAGNIYKNNTHIYNIKFYNINSSNDAFGGGCLESCLIENIDIERNGLFGSGSALDLTNRNNCIFNNINIDIKNTVAGNWGFASDFNATNEIVNNLIISGADYGVYYSDGTRNVQMNNVQIYNSRRNALLLDSFLVPATNIKLNNFIVRNWTWSSETFMFYMKNSTYINLINIDGNDRNERYGLQFVGMSSNYTILNSFFGNGTTPFDFGGGSPQFYMDNQLYQAGGIGNPTTYTCSVSSILAERTIHNSTTSCTCANGTWKCWGMT